MSADRLRQAAALLRERAETVDTPQGDEITESWSEALAANAWGVDSEYIAVVHPGVGLALADWLDDIAEWIEGRPFSTPTNSHALAVADQILGAS